MSYSIVKKQNLQPSYWSGGSTTELYIHPEGAVFKELNFDFRLSIATVEVEETTFTSLPGVSRTLMVLEGTATLQHEGHHTSKISSLEQDKFEGDWTTKCIGVLTDFNLMTSNNKEGVVESIELKENNQLIIPSKNQFELYYLYKGEIDLDNQSIFAGSLIIFDTTNNEVNEAQIMARQNCTLIHVSIIN